MLPVERLHRIKELIQKEKNLKISDLSNELGVSEMTIHRDLKPLVDEGIAIKTFGGVSLAKSAQVESNDMCIYCSRPIHEKLAYRLILQDNKIEIACCAHCGLLRHRQLGDDVIQAICYDFLKQTTISAQLTSFVLDTSIDIGCCQPQVLTFEWRGHAEKFVKGFGGVIYSFEEAMEVVFNKMKGAPCCHN